MATVLEEQEAMQQDNTLMDRPLKKIQHVQQANLCLSMSKEHFYAKIKLPTNFAGVENLSDLTKTNFMGHTHNHKLFKNLNMQMVNVIHIN